MLHHDVRLLSQYHEEEQLYNETSSVVTSGHVSKKKKKKMATGGGSISTSSSNVTIPQLCFHGDVEWLCYNMVNISHLIITFLHSRVHIPSCGIYII